MLFCCEKERTVKPKIYSDHQPLPLISLIAYFIQVRTFDLFIEKTAIARGLCLQSVHLLETSYNPQTSPTMARRLCLQFVRF
uniref:Uncharacterized protein n=1 Tax=Tanacetum cinerariifolium TaxID=118510 RepID=A0A6L2L5L0_TANCI|nr:hypothetical protein [Tanacetum cinerariifolium]